MRAAEQDRPSKVERIPLSVICANAADNITERNQNHLLRPVFINGVEVGFAYSQGESATKKLSVRGITISLWYFISRGHQAQALLPFCFKSYPDKSDGWDELVALYRMNLIEFTPGFGSDKYIEVNRIMALRAREYGGCMVARSQMHTIVEQNPLLDRTVEKKLLMPSFNGNDIIFPVDGPLGRNGNTFADTLTCAFEDPEWPRCALQQMNLRDQRIWMSSLADVTHNPQWISIAEKVCQYQPVNTVSIPPGHPPFEVSPFQLHPSETNPPENRGFSKLRRRTRRARLFDDGNYQRSGYNGVDYFPNRRKSWTSTSTFFDSNYYFVPSYRRNAHRLDEKKVTYIGRPNSIYRLNAPSSTNNDFKKGPVNGRKLEAADNLNRLASVFGYDRAKSICDRNPNLLTAKDGLSKLAHLVLEESEQEEMEQKTKDDGKKEDDLLPCFLPSFAPPASAKKHPTEKMKNAARAISDVTEGEKLVSDGNSDPMSSLDTDLPLEIAFMDKAIICSEYDDDEPVIVSLANQDNDLIYFSDSELEIEHDEPLREAELMM